ncbi:PREDICTED: ATP-binding cassette sub-family G member 2-like isoform X3 [Rhagoletis zephyria]|nr:PREDICTED: ATP-binding cassette sub-family G member 2-like isoform X3 [Rhagoletis zephyria]XP_017465487.1 PREDICTED: ATP-binding cassette sub-family G member 2-like isoform X3 [Rhagoletis zephyria]XP_017465488.1 PREDICTED: ATP-binding cassette sub-family G member 2-like isoform X3 [Rhagoletis zephyria]XP_017465489.1 PREDICTED: ATP-binding cassette sub-family G member 2-like isoform X3 [Rhagoletis zephyria]XP_017465490.1 PREDICTED: ATP-binding cassette sub-family G member 2-like isoform X3 [R
MSTPNINFGLFSAIEVNNSTNCMKTLSDSDISCSKSNRSSSSLSKAMNSGEVAQHDIITMSTLKREQPQTNECTNHSNISVDKMQSPKTISEIPATATKSTGFSAAIQRLITPAPDYKYGSDEAHCSAGRPLNVKISKDSKVEYEFAETRNATLSNTTIATPSGIIQPSQHKNVPPLTVTTSKSLAHDHQRQIKSLNIRFENICYGVKTGFYKREHKQILNGLTGEFRAGELSAVVGPSGAGKSTLLNILSSYKLYGFSGDIKINGNLRDVKTFKPNVAFLSQDTTLQPFLTVKEAMHFAANLKLGPKVTRTEKQEQVRKILKDMGLLESLCTRTGDLSGGQKKRLAISLELVNNPPVLILDEPTRCVKKF